MILPSVLAALLAPFTHPAEASAEQDGDQHDDAAGCANEAQCAEDRAAPPQAPGFVDLTAAANGVRYGRGPLAGKLKRSAYPLVDLSRRRVVIAIHQMGVELPVRWPSWHKVTAHWVVRTDGVPLWLHPVRVRLMATNRVDRAGWACIAIEVAGNFEGVDGSGRWAWGDRNGRGRASAAQILGARWCVGRILEQVEAAGGKVEGILPHIVTGRDSKGRPNRQICPGSRLWSEVGEWAGAEHGLAIPGPAFRLGGLPIPETWHGPHYAEARERLLAA